MIEEELGLSEGRDWGRMASFKRVKKRRSESFSSGRASAELFSDDPWTAVVRIASETDGVGKLLVPKKVA
jgi:hypothetical protein